MGGWNRTNKLGDHFERRRSQALAIGGVPQLCDHEGMTLRVFGNEPSSVFALLGKDENSVTFAMGWTLEQSIAFRELFISELLGRSVKIADGVDVDLQRHVEGGGFTDIELVRKNVCHLIIEAKRGWAIPSKQQLEKYARRLERSADGRCLIVSLSAATTRYASRHLPLRIGKVPVTHRSWADVWHLTDAAHRKASGFEEKLWLRHLSWHLKDYVSMQDPQNNSVYVVSLSAAPINEGNEYTWIDVVEQGGQYFHPVGNRWPVVPPNYIGFRYRGELQSVHHIDSYEVVLDLSEVDPRWPATDSDHFVYRLGPAMKPMRPMRTGNIYRNGRVWCAIDTLLSGAFDTISEARDETSRRTNSG
jgi:hypothetical protein